MKKIIALLVAITLSATPVFASNKYYENTTRTKIAPGVERILYQEVNDDQTIILNMIKVDLNEPTLSVDTLVGQEDIKDRFVLSDVINEQTLAAINGDYFNSRTHEAIGPMIKNEKWLQSGYADDTLSSFMVSKEHVAYINYLKTPQVKVNFKGSYIPFDYYNMNAFHLSQHQRIVLTRDFNDKSFGTSLGLPIIEVVVKDNVVTEVRQDQDPIDIPKNGFVMLFTGGKVGDAVNLTVGTEVELSIDDNKDEWQTLLRGGAKIVEDGNVIEDPKHNIKNRHPRTAIGTADNGKTLYLITADGRQGSIEGLTQKELAEILVSFDIEDVMCFDGGGSTELMSKLSYEALASITNHPSDGSERKIYNGLAINYQNDDAIETSYKFTDEKYYGVIGFPINLESVALDQNGVYLKNIDEDIKYSIYGLHGFFTGNTFIPTSAGNGVITGNYDGNSYSIGVVVEDNFKKMSVHPQVLQVDQEMPSTIRAYGHMSDGREVEIPNTAFHVLASDSGLSIELNKIKLAGESFDGYVTVKFGELEVSIPTTSEKSDIILNEFNTQEGQLKVHPSEVIADYEITDGKGKLYYDFTNTTKTRAAYIDFDNQYVFNNYPNSISIDVDASDANDQWLRGIIIDGSGKSTTIDFARYLSQEEMTLTADIPEGLPLPLTLKRIYVVETRALSQTKGTLYFDNLMVNMPVSSDVILPREENNIGTLVVIDPDRIDSIVIDENTSADVFEQDYEGGVLLPGQLPFNELIHAIQTSDPSKRLWILNLRWLSSSEKDILDDVLSNRDNDVYFYNYQKEYQMSMYLGYPHIKGPTLKIVKSAFSIYGK